MMFLMAIISFTWYEVSYGKYKFPLLGMMFLMASIAFTWCDVSYFISLERMQPGIKYLFSEACFMSTVYD